MVWALSRTSSKRFFKSLNEVPNCAEQGLGLGLAISKGISHVLGHQITMRSWLEKAVFFIEIPRCEEKPSPKR